MRLPGLDQEVIKVQSPFTKLFSDGWRGVSDCIAIGVGNGQEKWYTNRDLSEISMFGCDGLECHNDPFGVPRIEVKRHIREFCRFQEVDRNGPRPVCT